MDAITTMELYTYEYESVTVYTKIDKYQNNHLHKAGNIYIQQKRHQMTQGDL